MLPLPVITLPVDPLQCSDEQASSQLWENLRAWLGPVLSYAKQNTALLEHTHTAVLLLRKLIAVGIAQRTAQQIDSFLIVDSDQPDGMGSVVLGSLIAVIASECTNMATVLQATHCIHHVLHVGVPSTNPSGSLNDEISARFVALGGAEGLIAIHEHFTLPQELSVDMDANGVTELLTLSTQMLAELSKCRSFCSKLLKQFVARKDTRVGIGEDTEVEVPKDATEQTEGAQEKPELEVVAEPEEVIATVEGIQMRLKPLFDSCRIHARKTTLTRNILELICTCANHEYDDLSAGSAGVIVRSLIEEGAVEAIEAVMAEHTQNVDLQKQC